MAKDLLYIFFRLKYFPDNYSPCRLWEIEKNEWKYYYGSIYDPYQRGQLRKEVQKKEYEILFKDKEVCYQLCKSFNLPLPVQYGCIEPEEDYKSIIGKILGKDLDKKLIIKPVIGGGGKNIYLAYKEGDNIYVRGRFKTVNLDAFKLIFRSVIQEQIRQHDSLSKISLSLNTVRVVSLLTREKDVLIVGAIMRSGVGDAFIDNTSTGGIGVGINLEKGTLKKIGYDKIGRACYFHPTSGVSFENFAIPYWDRILELSINIQLSFPFYKLLCSDIGIKPDGPTIIEINPDHDNVGLEQKFGPILKDCRVKNEFREYNLLINNLSKT